MAENTGLTPTAATEFRVVCRGRSDRGDEETLNIGQDENDARAALERCRKAGHRGSRLERRDPGPWVLMDS